MIPRRPRASGARSPRRLRASRGPRRPGVPGRRIPAACPPDGLRGGARGPRLLDILACAACRAALARRDGVLACTACARTYPVVDGVPVLVTDPRLEHIRHEGELDIRDGFVAGIQRILDAIPPDLPVLDLGSGNRRSDDPRLVRLDVLVSPYVDLVGDAHALPFRDGSFGLVHSSAVFEHLRRPWDAAREIWRVLRPGGIAVVDCAFVFPFHGYPAVYFNASAEGIREWFRDFREITVQVLPWQGPSYSLRAVLGEYIRLFRPQSAEEKRFVETITSVAEVPLEEFDRRFTQDEAARIAACVTYMGVKQPSGTETLLPPAALAAWERDPALRARFRRPESPVDEMKDGNDDSLLRWAMNEGRAEPGIARWWNGLVRFRR